MQATPFRVCLFTFYDDLIAEYSQILKNTDYGTCLFFVKWRNYEIDSISGHLGIFKHHRCK
jgi:hypothetical protein